MTGASTHLVPTGAVLGGTAALGVLLVVTRLRRRRPTLVARVAPGLRSWSAVSRLLDEDPVTTPFAVLERLVAPWSTDVGRGLERFGSSRADVERRLARAGRRDTVEQFRARQLVAGAVGLALGLAVAVLLVVVRGASVVPALLLVVVAGVAGVLLCDQNLSRQVRTREERILAEFPTVAELLALAVTAGEAPVGALDRVARTAHGALADELSAALAAVRSGTPLSRALEELADRVGLAPVTRFADGVAVAVERGTPLADVLRAQAQDVREAGRRALLEAGGRKEVGMMVPVVFLVLPVTVAFAVFPSLATLRVGM
ncbi:type II secretion system F family protein [Luteimicrobium subarcticum]|uniref:Tight adherence protein C n=1 Tax=Luteimicrobium subarcticum TaxID=620910 RepID=A0A2M8WUH2_9MICO|nr:type II secretion system F family protein [Luteimicrobium subarcticum]PJI94549.1 tight adherence protein C [Luteimicrobium subarcticum]